MNMVMGGGQESLVSKVMLKKLTEQNRGLAGVSVSKQRLY